MNQCQDYCGIITYISQIKKSVNEDFQQIRMQAFDNQNQLKTYQFRLFGYKIRCSLKQGDLVVFKNGTFNFEKNNLIDLNSSNRSHILIGENEILSDKSPEYLDELKFIEQQIKNYQQQMQQFQNNPHQIKNFQGIICEVEDIKKNSKERTIEFMNIDEQGHFQIYKIKLFGVRVHQKITIYQKILIKNSSIKAVKGQYIRLNHDNGQVVTQIFIGQEQIKQSLKKDEYKKFKTQMYRNQDYMNQMLTKMKIGSASKKIKKNL